MTKVFNSPHWWPVINFDRNFSYFIVASSAAVIYDWAVTFGQELELVWYHPWSLMAFLYISLRYMGILYIIINMLQALPTLSITGLGCDAMYFTLNWMGVVVNAMLGAIMITRLYAMYRRSRNMLVFLIATFMAVTIACGVMTAIVNKHTKAKEFILSGTYQCTYFNKEADALILLSMTWILSTVWEVLALFLATCITIKHFRELQRPSRGWTIGDCFTALIQTHVVYFASFAAVSCFDLGFLSPQLSGNSFSVGTQAYYGVRQILSVMQMFVLGPRLILSVRQYHANLIDNSDAGTDMISMAFRERTDMSTELEHSSTLSFRYLSG